MDNDNGKTIKLFNIFLVIEDIYRIPDKYNIYNNIFFFKFIGYADNMRIIS